MIHEQRTAIRKSREVREILRLIEIYRERQQKQDEDNIYMQVIRDLQDIVKNDV